MIFAVTGITKAILMVGAGIAGLTFGWALRVMIGGRKKQR